jgi:hypothetical protein
LAVSNKGRRTIAVNGQHYIWFVRDDGEYSGIGSVATLHIIASDKNLIVAYPIHQIGAHNLIALHSLKIDEHTIADGMCRHVECPGWEAGKPITPGIVRKIIKWCLTDREHVDLNYLGELEPSEPEAEEPKTSHLRLVVSN